MRKAKIAWKKQAFVLSSLLLTCAASQARVAKTAGNGDILYSARYYLKPGTRNGSSHFHLYRINPDGSGKRQITFGAHDDTMATWSPNGRQITFLRDDKTWLLANADGTNLTKLMDISASNYWDSLRWSPDGRTIGLIHYAAVGKTDAETLYLMNLRTRKAQRILNVDHYAWSPDSRKLLLSGAETNFRVLDLRSNQTQDLPTNAPNSFAWISPNVFAAAVEKARDKNGDVTGIDNLSLMDPTGRVLRRFAMKKDGDGDLPDWRSYVEPIPNTSQAFLFASDESTSSGHEDVYFRASVIDGHMTRLAEGQFFAFAADGKRFLNVSYHDTLPYDTLPNGHPRVVYTTKLQIGTSEKDLRDIVSGFVIVYSADWRASH